MSTSVLLNRIATAKDPQPVAGFDAFVSDCDGVLSREFGISYQEVAEMIHPGMEAALSAFDNGVSPMEFVARTVTDHGFKSIPEQERSGVNAEDARNYNLAAAIISEFVGTTASIAWQRRQGGKVVYPLDDGYAVLEPIKSKALGTYGFCVSKQDGGVLSEEGFAIVSEGTRTDQWAAPEIGDVVDAFQQATTPVYRAY